MKAIATFLLLIASNAAHAWDCSYWSQSSNPKAECYKAAAAPSISNSAQPISNANAGASQTQNAAATANNQGNSQSVNLLTPRNAPAAFAGGTNTTAPCYTSIGAGISSTVGGLSFGSGRKAKDCARFILAQDLYSRGLFTAGDKVYCAITEIREALGETCLAVIAEQRTVEIQQTDTVSRVELSRLMRKALTK